MSFRKRRPDGEPSEGGPAKAEVRAPEPPAGQGALPAERPGDPLADDLARRVFQAIDEWRVANGMTALPRHIVFQQAVSILNAMDRTVVRGNRD